MREACEYAVDVGEKRGADEIETFWVKNVSMTAEAEGGHLSTASKVRYEGLRIRVVRNGALGSAFTFRMDHEAIENAVKSALNQTRVSPKDEYWVSLPSPKPYPRLDAWDPSMEHVDSDALMDPVTAVLELVPQDILVPFAGNEIVLRERVCVNSNGIEHEDRAALERYGVMAVGKLGEGVTPAFREVQYSRTYHPDPQKVAESLVTRINLFRHADTPSPGTSSVVFSPQALQELFYYTLIKALSGENVIKGRSLLAGKEGEKVACSTFTLHDNGTTKEGINSSEMDDEGVPCQDTPLIEKGILQGFIWDDYWAKRVGLASTGNAHYDERINEMVIQPTSMVVSPGKYTMEELFALKEGYYILGVQGAHGSNPESGDFSVLCNPAYRIRGGEISGGCTGMMVSDNVFALLDRIDGIGRESEVVEAAILPCVRFKDVNVVAM